jgi:hypothetical protein
MKVVLQRQACGGAHENRYQKALKSFLKSVLLTVLDNYNYVCADP